jgi:hypothetical protein
MGQFKPMVKMQTTEPSVVLKLKKGGSVHKPMKKMDGGAMGALSTAVRPRVSAPVAPAAAAPAKPSMAERRRAMMGRKGMAAPVMAKKGGEVESKAMHAKEATKAELKAHADKPASKAHKGLKTGGVVKGQGGYKTGGVVKGQGGFKKGGAVKKFADGGSVQDDGRAVDMPQGKKKPTPPVSISELAGTFKKGGAVKKADGGAMPVTRSAAVERKEASVSTPTAEEMKRLDDIYDRPFKKEQKGAENFQKNIRLRKKGGCV